jgi:hypothetical protein
MENNQNKEDYIPQYSGEIIPQQINNNNINAIDDLSCPQVQLQNNINAAPLNSNNNFIPFQQQEQINFNNFQQPKIYHHNISEIDGPMIIEIPTGADENLHVVSVIITICGGSSYDDLFRSVKQSAPEGRVAVFQINEDAISYFVDKFKKKSYSEDFINKRKDFIEKIEEIFGYLEEIEPDCVLFNYECCSNCGDFCFLKSESTNELIDCVINRKSNFMFSDFAVKSLLFNWDEKLFGKNPFKKIAECSTNFSLKFDPEILKNCGSEQLKIVGNLCENGSCNIHVMGGTIVFGVDKEKIDSEKYELQILTVIDNINSFNNSSTFLEDQEVEEVQDPNLQNQQQKSIWQKLNPLNVFKNSSKLSNKSNIFSKKKKTYTQINNSKYFWKIKEHTGAVGHALLKYTNGGNLILSAGHWIELSRLDVKLENLEKVSNNIYSNQFDFEINQIKNCTNISAQERKVQMSNLASKMIQQTSNCNYSKKAVFKKK